MVTNLELKQRINKLDYELKEVFENVYIKEKSVGKQFFFSIDCNGEFWNLNESKAYQRAEVKVVIHKSDLIKNPISWSYSSNPINENAHWIQRVSNFDDLSKDIIDVVQSCRMDESYFSQLPFVFEDLTEKSPEEYVDDDGKVINSKLQSMGVDVDEIDQEDKIQLEGNSFMNTKPEKKYSFYHHNQLSMADKFLLEQELNKIDGVNYTIFKEGVIEVNFSPID